jgi:hypothetical protein
VLPDADGHVFRDTDVEFAGRILDNVDAVLHGFESAIPPSGIVSLLKWPLDDGRHGRW